jgi:hypothetical protein
MMFLRIRRRHMKFVLVNGRTPRTRSLCALCCEPIGERYLRDIVTRLPYCKSQVLRRSLQSARPCTPIPCDGVLITPGASKYLP